MKATQMVSYAIGHLVNGLFMMLMSGILTACIVMTLAEAMDVSFVGMAIFCFGWACATCRMCYDLQAMYRCMRLARRLRKGAH